MQNYKNSYHIQYRLFRCIRTLYVIRYIHYVYFEFKQYNIYILIRKFILYFIARYNSVKKKMHIIMYSSDHVVFDRMCIYFFGAETCYFSTSTHW